MGEFAGFVGHIFDVARFLGRELLARLRFYPTITLLVRALRPVVLFARGWQLVGLLIWFTEITVRGIIFHYGGRLPGSDVDLVDLNEKIDQ
jgi:hypothetical protein